MRSCILLTGMFAPSVGLWFPGIAGAVGSRVVLAHALPGMAAKQHLHVLGDVLPSGGPVINAVSCENLQAAESIPRMVSRWAMLVWPALPKGKLPVSALTAPSWQKRGADQGRGV